MDQKEFSELRATMPWQHRFFTHPRSGGIVQVIDRNGNEVPLFPMVRFLDHITARLSVDKTPGQAQPPQPPQEETPK